MKCLQLVSKSHNNRLLSQVIAGLIIVDYQLKNIKCAMITSLGIEGLHSKCEQCYEVKIRNLLCFGMMKEFFVQLVCGTKNIKP